MYCAEKPILIVRMIAVSRSNVKSKGLVFAAFGAGLLLALCFPTKIMLFILAIMLVILGIMCCTR